VAQRIMAGQGEVAVAGGTESMTMLPMAGNKFSPNPWLVENHPDTYLNMGLTAENLAKKYGITREQSDEFSYASHQKAIAAIAAGKFKEEIVPVAVSYNVMEAAAGNESANGAKPKTFKVSFDTDEGPRSDTSAEALGKLKPAFHARGVVTAGNSSQMSDGAAASVVMSVERAGDSTARAVRCVRGGGMPSGRNGNWTGIRDSQSLETRGPDARSD